MKSCCEHHRFNCDQGRTCPLRKARSFTRNQIKIAICLAVIFIGHGIVSNMDYEDELAAQAYARSTQTAQGGDTK